MLQEQPCTSVRGIKELVVYNLLTPSSDLTKRMHEYKSEAAFLQLYSMSLHSVFCMKLSDGAL